MIFPILAGIIGWQRAPVTWAIVALNFIVLCFTSVFGFEASENLSAMMKKEYFVTTQGRVYAQYLTEQARGSYPPFLTELAAQVSRGEKGRADLLGQLAFRDLNFLNEAPDLSYEGDQVAFRLWRKQIGEVRDLQGEHPSFTLGLNSEDPSFSKWISYIFVHSGGLHFIGNMLFLVIFGAALECQIGGLGLLVVFLLSGVFGAGAFAMVTGMTSSPLVGASGAVSGVMTLYCILNWGRPERYFYWLFLPFRGFMGFIYLPAWVALVMWFASDMAGYLSTLAELGGVAHTAHLGGEVAGVLVALTLYCIRRLSSKPWRPAQVGARGPMGVLLPLLPR